MKGEEVKAYYLIKPPVRLRRRDFYSEVAFLQDRYTRPFYALAPPTPSWSNGALTGLGPGVTPLKRTSWFCAAIPRVGIKAPITGLLDPSNAAKRHE